MNIKESNEKKKLSVFFIFLFYFLCEDGELDFVEINKKNQK